MNNKLYAEGQRLAKLNEESKSQSEQIASLLPTGASAGLAHAFAARAQGLERTKWIWMSIFIVSVVFLALMAYRITLLEFPTKEEIWVQLLRRIPLASPWIWLGYFSAVQYGNTIRVQEDYAFKEATSKAFAGYRDHMQQLSKIKSAEGLNALELLATNTIHILAREPLRVYNKPDRDVSPAQLVLEIMRAKQEKATMEAAKQVVEEQ